MIAKIAIIVQTLVLCQNSLLRIVILCALLNRNLLFKRIRNIVDIVDFNMQFAVLIFFRILQNDSIRLVFVSFSKSKAETTLPRLETSVYGTSKDLFEISA